MIETVKQMRDRTSNAKTFPVDTIKQIVRDVEADCGRDEFIGIIERRLEEMAYVSLSRNEVQELIRICLQELGHGKKTAI